jgi:ethanolamine utilization protein EutA
MHQLDHHHDHDHDDDHGHGHGHGHEMFGGAADQATQDLTWELENLELVTVGIDIGSATSSLMFARLSLRRQSQQLSSRFEVVKREVIHRSPVTLTPYVDGEQIDTTELGAFVEAGYADAGLAQADVDTGVVILTGMALLRKNAQAVGEMLAHHGGKFVCAAAGHNLEALLAAHGAGAVSRSATDGSRILSLDVGGGTSKLTLAEAGTAVATAAVLGGGRLLAWDDQRRVIRCEDSLAELCATVGVKPVLGEVISTEDVTAVIGAITDQVMSAVAGTAPQNVLLAGGLPESGKPDLVLLSGGVAQHLVDGGNEAVIGDLGAELAHTLQRRLVLDGYTVGVSANPIAATVVGASQFSAQVSGDTVSITAAHNLPIRNLPVVAVDLSTEEEFDAAAVAAKARAGRTRLSLDLEGDLVAYSVRWGQSPFHHKLLALAKGLMEDHRAGAVPGAPMVICLDSDIAASAGRF